MSTFDSQNTGLSSSTTSSAERFGLDEASTKDILVYRVRGGYEVTNEKNLCRELDKGGTRLRLTTKAIPRTKSSLDIVQRDLLYEPERIRAMEKRSPTQTLSMANFHLPPGVKWRRRLLGQFDQLYIVSPNSSGSLADSQGSSGAGSQDTSGENSPDGPTRAGTGDMMQTAGR